MAPIVCLTPPIPAPTVEATYHLVVPLIYWGLLADNAPKPNEDPFGFWIDVSVHGLEAGFILGDVFLNRSVCYSMPLHPSAND
jgi:hypothetical protein